MYAHVHPADPCVLAMEERNQGGPDVGPSGGWQSCVRFTDIACGASHSVALDEEGRVYTWGSSAEGRLGLSDAILRALRAGPIEQMWWPTSDAPDPLAIDVLGPVRVEGCDVELPRMVQIASGSAASSTLAAARDGRVYGWGAMFRREEAPRRRTVPGDDEDEDPPFARVPVLLSTCQRGTSPAARSTTTGTACTRLSRSSRCCNMTRTAVAIPHDPAEMIE